MRIRKIGPSNRRTHAGASKIPAFDTLTVESNTYLVLEDANLAGCGGGLPRIAYSRNGTSNRWFHPQDLQHTRHAYTHRGSRCVPVAGDMRGPRESPQYAMAELTTVGELPATARSQAALTRRLRTTLPPVRNLRQGLPAPCCFFARHRRLLTLTLNMLTNPP